MECINKIILQGWVEDAPEVRYFSYDLVRTALRLRTEEEARGTQGERSLRLWHRVVAWGDVAKYIGQHVHSGDGLKVYGHLRYHRETDRHGISNVITEIEAVKVERIVERPKQEQAPPPLAPRETDELPWEQYAPTEGEDPMA